MKTILLISLGLVLIVGMVMVIFAIIISDTRSATHKVRFNATLEQVWTIYTTPARQPEWRTEIATIEHMNGDLGHRTWTEVDHRGLRISFQEIIAEPPRRYELNTSSDGYFEGHYSAVFEYIEPGVVEGTFTESMTTQTFLAKIMAFVFVRPRAMIENYAAQAQREIDRRRLQ